MDVMEGQPEHPSNHIL